MNTQLDAIQSLIQLNRKTLRELAEVADTTSADFAHISKAQDALNEQFHILLQQKEETEAMIAAQESLDKTTPSDTNSSSTCTTTEKRGRGAVKQFYLKDVSQKISFVAHLQRIFIANYIPGKKFRLMDGSEVKAPSFLACLYDLGIKLGITSPEVPVRDFCDMVTKAATECAKTHENVMDFNTAYNTVQRATKCWKPFTGKDASLLYCTTVRLHEIVASVVPAAHRKDYEAWMALYDHVEQIYHATEEA